MTDTPWLARMTQLLGLAEAPGSADNPQVLAMARAVGGDIAKSYTHDSIAWCALAANYVLVSTGFKATGTLWALDFAKWGVALSGPAVGAIAVKTRDGGGHVTLVVGRTAAGKLVCRGGNQSDMVCDELFNATDFIAFRWPSSYPLPAEVGLGNLPVVTPAPSTRSDVKLPAAGTPAPAAPPAASTKVVARYTGIRATEFGGPKDENTSAYDGARVDPKVPGVALPARVPEAQRSVRVFANGRSVVAAVVDVGPWNTKDPYWTTGLRPQAECGVDRSGRKTNLAGIDLTTAAWDALGVAGAPGTRSGVVEWEFVTAAPATAPEAPQAPVAAPLAAPAAAGVAAVLNAIFKGVRALLAKKA